MLPLLLIIATAPILLAIYIRARLTPAKFGLRTRLDDLNLGPSLLFWLLGLFSLAFLPSLYDRVSANTTLVPRPFPIHASGFGGYVVMVGFVLAWIASWAVGTPITALAGVPAALVVGAVLTSAGLLADHVSLALPEAPLWLALVAVACVQCVRCFTFIRNQVGASTTCSNCKYDLSKTPDAPCPECGTPHAIAAAAFVRRVALSKRAPRIALSWAAAVLVATFAPPVGLLTVMVTYLSRGIPFDSALQLAQQYEGNTGSPLSIAWPLTLSGIVASLVYQNAGISRRWLLIWLLIPLGVAATFALRLFV